MTRRTMIVDDERPLLRSFRERGRKYKLDMVDYYHSLRDARQAVQREVFDRVIADHKFEGEEDDGLAFLEDVRRQRGTVDLVLLTGQPVTGNMESRLEALNARVIKKQGLSRELVDQLLVGDEIAESTEPSSSGVESSDVGELRLEVETLRDEVDQLRGLNDLLVADIIEELKTTEEQNQEVMLIGDRMYSPKELRYEVENRTEVGREMIRVHHQMFKLMREGK